MGDMQQTGKAAPCCLQIDINKLGSSGKTEENFTFPFVPERQLLSLPSATIGKATVSVTVRLVKGGAVAEGEVTYTVNGECSRCLKPASATFTEEFTASFGTAKDAEYPVRAGIIDLTAAVEELIVTASPQVIYCREDCKGLCPDCGADLNAGECNCKNFREVNQNGSSQG